MYPPIFSVCAADPAVVALLSDGGGRIRLYPFGEAPQHDPHVYAVWQIVYGAPENSLSCPPDLDRHGVQVDVYASNCDDARSAARALRDAIESAAYVVSWNGETRDPTTRAYRVSFTSDWHSPRE
jgi:hypothetical protein